MFFGKILKNFKLINFNYSNFIIFVQNFGNFNFPSNGHNRIILLVFDLWVRPNDVVDGMGRGGGGDYWRDYGRFSPT